MEIAFIDMSMFCTSRNECIPIEMSSISPILHSTGIILFLKVGEMMVVAVYH